MKVVLSYWPMLFVLAFFLCLVITAIRLFKMERKDTFAERVFELDKYMISNAQPASEEDIVKVMSNYNFQYRGWQNP